MQRGSVAAGIALVLGSMCPVLAVDGIAVSAVSATPCGGTGFSQVVVKYSIHNDNVTRCDTIYNAFQASYPHLNLHGTMCAFFRRGIGQADTNRSAGDVYTYLSVMDINGGNVRDLDTVYTWEFHTTMGSRLTYSVDWPAGDYLYYSKQVKWWYDNDGIPTAEVWKVKFNDPSSKTLVVKYRDAKTFGMSLDATRAGVTELSNNEFKNLPHAFPPATPPTKAGWDNKVWGGCGSYVSPSGEYHHHFYTGGHEAWRINRWNPPNELLATVDVSSGDFPAWSVDPTLTGGKIGGGDMQWARWAVNSDKWIAGSTKLYNMQVVPPFPTVGHNQVLADWVGHKVIVTSRNWQPSGDECSVRHSEPGDFWVAGGPPTGNAYEGVDGNWYDAITHELVQEGTVGAGDMPRGTRPAGHLGAGAVTALYNVKGERVGSFRLGDLRARDREHLRQGTYIAGGLGSAARVVVVDSDARRR